jgi:hypothetical protein
MIGRRCFLRTRRPFQDVRWSCRLPVTIGHERDSEEQGSRGSADPVVELPRDRMQLTQERTMDGRVYCGARDGGINIYCGFWCGSEWK